jgi:hypothetical protein
MKTPHCKRAWIMVAMVVSGMALSALVSGCGTLGLSAKTEPGVHCPTCNRKVAQFHPKQGMTYRKTACPSCETVRVIDSQTGAHERMHVCDQCDQLVNECPECRKKIEKLKARE